MARSRQRTSARSAERAERMREARRIEPSKAGTAAGILSILCALGSLLAIVMCLILVAKVFGAFALGSRTQFFLLNLITGACLIIGGVGILVRKGWGWWLAFVGAVIGLLDLARLFRGLFAIINPDHPEAAATTVTLLQWVSGPAALYVVVLIVLTQRGVRENFRISSVDRGRGRRRSGDEERHGEE